MVSRILGCKLANFFWLNKLRFEPSSLSPGAGKYSWVSSHSVADNMSITTEVSQAESWASYAERKKRIREKRKKDSGIVKKTYGANISAQAEKNNYHGTRKCFKVL